MTGAHQLSKPEQILHIAAPTFPQFRFEYHPQKRRVYLARVGAKPEIGEVLAHEIDNDGAAQNAVLIWLRGYRTAKGERWNDGGKLIERPDDHDRTQAQIAEAVQGTAGQA